LQLRVESGLERALVCGLPGIAGYRDQENDVLSESLSNPARDLVPIHLRQPDVNQREPGRILDRLFNPRWAALGDVHIVPPDFQQLAQPLAQIDVVFDDQHSSRNDLRAAGAGDRERSEEHTSELQSLTNLVCRLLLEKKNNN